MPLAPPLNGFIHAFLFAPLFFSSSSFFGRSRVSLQINHPSGSVGSGRVNLRCPRHIGVGRGECIFFFFFSFRAEKKFRSGKKRVVGSPRRLFFFFFGGGRYRVSLLPPPANRIFLFQLSECSSAAAEEEGGRFTVLGPCGTDHTWKNGGGGFTQNQHTFWGGNTQITAQDKPTLPHTNCGSTCQPFFGGAHVYRESSSFRQFIDTLTNGQAVFFTSSTFSPVFHLLIPVQLCFRQRVSNLGVFFLQTSASKRVQIGLCGY